MTAHKNQWNGWPVFLDEGLTCAEEISCKILQERVKKLNLQRKILLQTVNDVRTRAVTSEVDVADFLDEKKPFCQNKLR